MVSRSLRSVALAARLLIAGGRQTIIRSVVMLLGLLVATTAILALCGVDHLLTQHYDRTLEGTPLRTSLPQAKFLSSSAVDEWQGSLIQRVSLAARQGAPAPPGAATFP